MIERQQLKPKDLQREEKRRGNLKRYDVGTVAEIKKSDVCKFFCLGLSYFDRDLTAHTSKDDYVLAMQKMIEYCYARSQGDAVIIPLIGAGLSKTKYGERAILEYLVKSLKLNKDLIVSDIYIVVRNSGKETIPITEAVKNIGVHAPMCYRGDDGVLHWDYNSVKKAFDKSDNC